jgi:hypothetical protein
MLIFNFIKGCVERLQVFSIDILCLMADRLQEFDLDLQRVYEDSSKLCLCIDF